MIPGQPYLSGTSLAAAHLLVSQGGFGQENIVGWFADPAARFAGVLIGRAWRRIGSNTGLPVRLRAQRRPVSDVDTKSLLVLQRCWIFARLLAQAVFLESYFL